MSQAPVPVVSPPEVPAPQTLVCANCGAPLGGEYCNHCGQRHEPHVHSVRHFASEAFESITHADSRLWRTLWFLLAKPGILTREFFAGRRARYLPPFRLYLVLSIVFFLMLGSTNGDDPGVAPTAAADPAARQLRDQALAEANKALAESGGPRVEFPADRIQANVKVSFIDDFCAPFKQLPDKERQDSRAVGIRRMCDRFETGDFTAVGEAVLHNLPRAMFVFLPVLALCMKLMYWRPKRYYVEHLLFLVHNHAFVFLLFSLALLLGLVPGIANFPGTIFWITFLYAAWYIYRAMRNVYGQRRAITLPKYLVLCVVYLQATFVMLLLTFLFAAMY
jgi:hypothetical protein